MAFILSGYVIAIYLMEENSLTNDDWKNLLLFCVLSQVIRIVVVLSLYPLLKRLGYGCSRKMLILLMWCPLKGSS